MPIDQIHIHIYIHPSVTHKQVWRGLFAGVLSASPVQAIIVSMFHSYYVFIYKHFSLSFTIFIPYLHTHIHNTSRQSSNSTMPFSTPLQIFNNPHTYLCCTLPILIFFFAAVFWCIILQNLSNSHVTHSTHKLTNCFILNIIYGETHLDTLHSPHLSIDTPSLRSWLHPSHCVFAFV